jgi:hypothetical protein
MYKSKLNGNDEKHLTREEIAILKLKVPGITSIDKGGDLLAGFNYLNK